jgi:hypothetical protein
MGLGTQGDIAMKYYSESTKKFYDSADDCAAAEKELAEKKALATREKEELAAKRKEDADKIKEILERRNNIEKEYRDAVNDFVKKYGSYHYTYTSNNLPSFRSWIDDWFDNWFIT